MSAGLRSGQVAEAAGVNIQTLRYYERRGLLAEPDRSAGGHRLYGEEAVTVVRVIKAAQRLGFTLEEVAELLETGRHHHGRPVPGLQERAAAKLAEIDVKITDLTTIRAALVAAVEAGPFLEAFVFLIVIPLALAWLTQGWAARHPAGQKTSDAASAAMVPLMAATLFTVVASQVPKLGGSLADVAAVVPVYAAFLAVMAFAGLAVARLFRLTAPDSRAIVFTGATRNSLVVLPLALALPDDLAVAAVVVVTQTLVEVVGMVIYVRAIPRLVPATIR
ncbi:MerR family transcriptional regulator [Streptomyces megasporus]|uniref:MerR family transcriptional regulator n=1 Tax=Streptomyces megasporus TaxID=44060 RepID=UPI0009965851|nr:MerR family transcriptional regulator [Streptomyces megasporus]